MSIVMLKGQRELVRGLKALKGGKDNIDKEVKLTER